MITVLTLPVWHNSGPLYWQTLWEQQNQGVKRVQQRDWETPRREDWLARICDEVNAAPGSVVLVGHSLGCIAVAHCCQINSVEIGKVKGALLVAPADVEHPDTPPEIRDFAPIPHQRLPFVSIVIASANDPWLSLDRAAHMSAMWGSSFVNIGSAGHINSESGLGDWPEGKRILRRLLEA